MPRNVLLFGVMEMVTLGRATTQFTHVSAFFLTGRSEVANRVSECHGDTQLHNKGNKNECYSNQSVADVSYQVTDRKK